MKPNKIKTSTSRIIIFSLSLLVFVIIFLQFASSRDFIINEVSNPSTTYFMVNGTSGYTGIGTPTPGYKLDVNGTARIAIPVGTSGYAITISMNSSNQDAFYASDVQDSVPWRFGPNTGTTGTFSWYNGTATLFSIYKAGNVAITSGNLSMNSRYITNLANPLATTDAATKAYVDSVTGGGTAAWSVTSNVVHLNTTTNRVSIGGTTSAYKLDVLGNVSLNSTLFVTTGGLVGIGTTSPTHTLNVLGNVNITWNITFARWINAFGGSAIGANLIPISAEAWRTRTDFWQKVSDLTADIYIADAVNGSEPVPTGKVHYFTNISTSGANSSWYMIDHLIPINPNITYYGRIWAARHSGTGIFYAGYIAYNKDLTVLNGNGGTYGYFITSGSTPSANGTWYYGTISGEGSLSNTFPNNTRYIRPLIIVNYNNNGTNPGNTSVGGFEISTTPFERYGGIYSIATKGTERFTITGSGDVGIGTASPNDKLGIGTTSPTHKLNVLGNANITTNLTVGENLFVNQSSVGIGTTSPSSKLEISMPSSGTGINLYGSNKDIDFRIGHSINYSYYWRYAGTGSGDANYLYLYSENQDSNDIEIFRFGQATSGLNIYGGYSSTGVTIDQDGNIATSGSVGIGTTSPTHTLNILGTTNITGLSYFGANLSMGGFQINNLGTPTQTTDAATKAYVDSVTGGGGSTTWSLASNVVYLNDTTDRVSIGGTTSAYKLDVLGNVSLNSTLFVTTGGLVGIGTSSPSNKLDIQGSLSINGSLKGSTYQGLSNIIPNSNLESNSKNSGMPNLWNYFAGNGAPLSVAVNCTTYVAGA